MKSIEQLPQVAQQGLAGLEAGQNLKYRILREAAQPVKRQRRMPVWAPAMCAAMALVIALMAFVPSLMQPDDNGQLIIAMPAGETTAAPILTSQGGITGGSISGGRNVSGESLWSPNVNGSMPVIGVNGAFYRMMEEPASVKKNLLGDSIGKVEEFTTEPALSGLDVILSNVSGAGTQVYKIKNMGGTLIAAQVDGTMRLFQRVGFNGSALRGGESLQDTLQVTGKVQSLELSGVGIVDNAKQAEKLIKQLFASAEYASSGSVNGSQVLLIHLDNGLTLQMAVKNDKLSACGTWSCPEFFEAFAEAAH